MKRWITAAVVLIAVVGLWFAPDMLERGDVNALWYIFFGIILASSWNLLGGMAGQVSFGYSAFLGIGAYATVLLSLKGINPFMTMPIGAAIAALFSFVVGLPTFRLRGPYFTIATIGISEAVRVYVTAAEWTGGSSGKRMPSGAGSFEMNYYTIFILCVIVLAIVFWIQRSRFGIALNAIKQDEDAAEALGMNTNLYKLLAHALSAALVSLAGSLYAINFQYISPSAVFVFSVILSIVLMPVVGGVGTLLGPIVGGVIFQYLRLQLSSSPNKSLRESDELIYGLLLIAIMLFEPKGVMGLFDRLTKFVTGLVKRNKSGEAKAHA